MYKYIPAAAMTFLVMSVKAMDSDGIWCCQWLTSDFSQQVMLV
jgi:hypothetical protein